MTDCEMASTCVADVRPEGGHAGKPRGPLRTVCPELTEGTALSTTRALPALLTRTVSGMGELSGAKADVVASCPGDRLACCL